MQVIGRAQARYLWILLVAGVFFLALHESIKHDTAADTVTAPFLGIEVSAEVVWAWGPAILAYVILVIMGSLRAYTRAHDQAGLGSFDFSGEPYDSSPNALDLAAYTTPESRRWIKVLLYFKYPLFLSLFVVEAILIEIELAQRPDPVSTGLWALGAVPLIPAAWQLAGMWAARIERALREWQETRSSARNGLLR
jgi:hypothetical protein